MLNLNDSKVVSLVITGLFIRYVQRLAIFVPSLPDFCVAIFFGFSVMALKYYVVICLVTLMVLGCGGGRKRPKTARVAGTVYLDGKPLEGVEVSFLSDEFKGYGKTDSSGRYELVQGAVPGVNKVYFSKIKPGAIELDPEAGIDEEQLRAMSMAEDGGGGPADIGGEIIPDHYSDPEQSKLTYDVSEGGDEAADFRLTSN
ncbi:MAG: hypothetical protein KDA62_17680 [Planctomycetales bacterium]|nr:hypothetical protein [Planctomycetales bacterium]